MDNSLEMFNYSCTLWFNNRRVSKVGDVSVYIQVIIDGKHKEFPQKIRWPVNLIDRDKCQLLPREKRDRDVGDFNLEIQSNLAKYTEILRTYRLRRQNIDITIFSREVRTFDHRECFLTFMKNEIERRYRRREIELKTYQNHKAVRKLLIGYDPICQFGSINMKWMSGFKNHLQNTEVKPGKKYEAGTIWAAIKSLKTYLNLASEEPMLYVDPAVVDFPNPKPKTKTVFLNRDEIRRLLILDSRGYLTSVQEQVLSAFLFTCFTSLRISDVYRVGAHWSMTEDSLEFTPFKNRKRGKTVRIPLVPMAKMFIQNQDGFYFQLPTEPEYNRTLKDLAEMAEINKKLTSHVGRHTYGYLYMTTAGNIKALQEILGHSSSLTTERYAHLDDEYKLRTAKMIQNGFNSLFKRSKK